MVDKNGKVLDLDSTRQIAFTFDSKSNKIAFDELKFVLDYEDFFAGRHLFVTSDPNNHGMHIIAHRCGSTVFRVVSNVFLGQINPARYGFYTFDGDDGEAFFPESWKSKIRITLRCRTDNAEEILNNHPDYEAAPEWQFILRNHLLHESYDKHALHPCNPFVDDDRLDREYWGNIVFSKFLQNLYHEVGRKAFFDFNSMKRFFDPEAQYAIIGSRKDTIAMRYRWENGVTENTFIFSMDEESGYFDYDMFNKSN